MVNFLKEKKEIDYFLLLLNFYSDRIDKSTREYINNFGKIFTPREFLTHLCIFFTKYPKDPTEKDKKKCDKYLEQIHQTLKKIFNIKEDEEIPSIKVYFIDTEIKEREEAYKEKNQDIIDNMLKSLINEVEHYNNSIDTTNLETTGINVEIRKKEEKDKINNIIEGLQKRNSMKEEIAKLQNEVEIEKNDGLRKMKMKKLNEYIKQQEEEEKLIDQMSIKNEKYAERDKEIEEEARKKKIDFKKIGKKYGVNIVSILFCLGGICVTAFAPELTFLSILFYSIPISASLFKVQKDINKVCCKSD